MPQTGKRDKDLDVMRGFAMMYVIFIHCLFWFSFFASGKQPIIKSFFLVEMPLFFFVTGAASFLARPRSLGQYYLSRFNRVLIPYWFYAAICVLLNIIAPHPSLSKKRLLLSWINPFDQQINSVGYLNWATWFVSAYLLIVVFIPLIKFFFTKCEKIRYIPLLLCPLALLALDQCFHIRNDTVNTYLRYLLCYSFFTYIGFYYQFLRKRETLRHKIKALLLSFTLLLLTIGLICTKIYSPNMQTNKFPPNFIFVVYNAAILCIFYLVYPWIIKLLDIGCKINFFNAVFDQYQNRCFTVYLYQPFAFSLLISQLNYYNLTNIVFKYYLIGFPLFFILSLCLASLFGFVFGPVESASHIISNFLKERKKS